MVSTPILKCDGLGASRSVMLTLHQVGHQITNGGALGAWERLQVDPGKSVKKCLLKCSLIWFIMIYTATVNCSWMVNNSEKYSLLLLFFPEVAHPVCMARDKIFVGIISGPQMFCDLWIYGLEIPFPCRYTDTSVFMLALELPQFTVPISEICTVHNRFVQ